MTLLRLRLRFAATHQIRIGGELEPVHGHEFACEMWVSDPHERDASLLEPRAREVLGRLERTHLQEVERAEGGAASAERAARYLFRAFEEALLDGFRVERVVVHEAAGCSASFGRGGGGRGCGESERSEFPRVRRSG